MSEIKGQKAIDGKSFRLVGYTVCFATTQRHHLAHKNSHNTQLYSNVNIFTKLGDQPMGCSQLALETDDI